MIKKTKKTAKKIAPVAREEKNKDIGVKKTKIRVIGVGGGGSSIVSEIASNVGRVSFAVANTDLQALRTSNRKALHFQFGESLTRGLGTGMNVEIGKLAAQNETERIKKIMEGQDLCIIVACLGGGTGTGAAPIFAKISRDLGNITYGIFTLPFSFEGERKMEIAKNALKELKSKVNAFSVIPNERIFQIIDKSTPIRAALSAINKNLANSLQGLIEMIYQPGLINIDFADLRTVLQGQGRLAYLNTIEVRGAKRSEEAIKEVLNSPLYPYGIKGAKGILLNIAGEKNLGLSEISQISKSISGISNKEAKIIFGIAQNKKYSGIIKTTLLATGCGSLRMFSDGAKKTKKKTKKSVVKKERVKVAKKKNPRPIKMTIKKIVFAKKKPEKTVEKKEKNKNKNKTKKPKKKIKVQNKNLPQEPQFPKEDVKENNAQPLFRVRKNAIQIKKETEEVEKEMLEKEKFWETPAFLRKKKFFIQ